jgi:archaemetzincin
MWLGLVALALAGGATWCTTRLEGPRRLVIAMLANTRQPSSAAARLEDPRQLEIATHYQYPELESRLVSLARPLGPPRPGEWLHEHKEPGQTFDEYRQAAPVRRSHLWNRIYLCLIGEFSPEQQTVLDRTREYLEIFFDTPVAIRRRVRLEDIPASARRRHPKWGDAQILTTYVLDELLKPDRPDDALAYLAFTASDLWPGKNWNFVFGQASLHQRTGVWSIYRNGDPAGCQAQLQLCLRRTLGTAAHETGHILSIPHCITHECIMNGSNSQKESDSRPLYLCPACLRKLCWNLQVEPAAYMQRLRGFCQHNGLLEEAEWYRRALGALKR